MNIQSCILSYRRRATALLLATAFLCTPPAWAQSTANPLIISAPHGLPGTPVTITAQVPTQGREFRFDFGDGTADTGWITSSSVTHTYPQAGHYNVVLQVRDSNGLQIFRRVVTVTTPPTGGKGASSAPIALNGTTGELWVVNPDNDSVSKVVADALVGEYPLGEGCHPRGVALDAQQQAWVTCHERDSIKVVNPSGQVVRTIATDYGSAPFGIVMSPDGTTAHVSLYGDGAVASFDTKTFDQTATLPLGPTARGLGLSPDGKRLLVTRFISPESRGEVWDVAVDRNSLRLVRTIPLIEDSISAETIQSGRGVPNYVASVSFDREMKKAWVVYKKDNVHRGLFLNGVDLNQENSVRTSISEIDLTTNAEVFSRRRDIDNTDSPTGVAFSDLGDYAFVTLQGNDIVAIYDTLQGVQQGAFVPILLRVKVGSAPQGILFDEKRKALYVHDFLSRSVTVLDARSLLDGSSSNIVTKKVKTIVNEKLPANVLRGKQIFYNASDASGPNGRNRMSGEGYISCATCHVDGGSDGRVWDFTGRGEGLRNTTDLRGRAGMLHGRVHWSGNFDEIQDFENDIRNAFGGTGFMSDADFIATSNTLGPKKAGKSADLDALAAYVTSLDRSKLPRSPHRNNDGTMTESAKRGQLIFKAQGCDSCHSGNQYTDSAVDRVHLHNIGTISSGSGSRLGGSLEGIDTPTLLGVFDAAPYLHDGSALTLSSVFDKGAQHKVVSALPQASKEDLMQFLLQLDATPEGAVPPTPQPTLAPTPGTQRYGEVGKRVDELSTLLSGEVTKAGLMTRQEVRKAQSLLILARSAANSVKNTQRNRHLKISVAIERCKVMLLRATRVKTAAIQDERLRRLVGELSKLKNLLN